MISDLAGSSGTRADGKMGTGLPGPIVSLLKEASALPIFKKLDKNGNKEFSVWISKLFNGTLLAERDANGKITKAVKCDLRTELGAIKQLGKQAIPVLINECVVSGFYLIRRLITEIKDKKPKSFGDFKELDWRTIAPTKNRTIVRMLTISTGTMTAIDLADAAIESAIESAGAAATGPGVAAAFATHMLLKVNFVGLGRFAIAIGTDVSMGIKKDSYVAKRTAALQKQLNLYQSKVFLKQADVFCSLAETYATAKDLYLKEEEVWTEVVSNEEAINELITRISLVTAYYLKTYDEMISTTYGIAELLPEAEKNNPGLNKILFGGR